MSDMAKKALFSGLRNGAEAPVVEKPSLFGGKPIPKAAHEEDSPDYARFKTLILKKTGIDLNLYKQQQMQRRLYNMVERAGLATFQDYYDLLERDEEEFASFLDRMTINVSELFRNVEKWAELKNEILPALLKQKSSLKIWSAGCSYGAEPYSLAILLAQLTPQSRHTLHATDIDRKILGKAQEGRFSIADVKNVAPDALRRYFDALPYSEGTYNPTLPRYQVNSDIRSRVLFRRHNLLADRFEGDYDLICCRNVVIYFTDEAKDKLYRDFVRSLRIGGVLFVGGTERIFQYQELGLDSPVPFFYRRVR